MKSKNINSSRKAVVLTKFVVDKSPIGNIELEVEPAIPEVQVQAQLQVEPTTQMTRSSSRIKNKDKELVLDYSIIVDLDPSEVEP